MRTATITLTLAALVLTACTKQEVVNGGGLTSNMAPALVLEQFLRAANAKDLDAMGRLFGTVDGPITERDSRSDVERRMFALASVLRHDDFEVIGEQQVPGRTEIATKLLVRIKNRNVERTVPFVMVRYKQGGWLVEQIDIDVITNPR